MRTFQTCEFCERRTWMDHGGQCDECHRDGVDARTDPEDVNCFDGGRIVPLLDHEQSPTTHFDDLEIAVTSSDPIAASLLAATQERMSK